jgi:hypothetical protein
MVGQRVDHPILCERSLTRIERRTRLIGRTKCSSTIVNVTFVLLQVPEEVQFQASRHHCILSDAC